MLYGRDSEVETLIKSIKKADFESPLVLFFKPRGYRSSSPASSVQRSLKLQEPASVSGSTDVTADRKEVRGQRACFIHHCGSNWKEVSLCDSPQQTGMIPL